MSPRLAFAIDAAVQAGKSTLAHFQTGIKVDLKGDKSPVTVADRNAERLLRELIEAKYPGEKVLGEEEGGDEAATRWVIDPIDGTKSFISGVPLYATLLAFEEDHQPTVGVVYFPALDILLYAETGGGAWINGRPAHVSSKASLDGSTVSCGGHKSMLHYGKWDGFTKIIAEALVTRTWADAYGHMLVATGQIDAMVDPVVSRWDLAPFGVIIPEAGGTFSKFDGTPVLTGDYGLEAISSNGVIHEAILGAYRA